MTAFTAGQVSRWADAGTRAYLAAWRGENPVPALRELGDAPGHVWRLVALEWVETTRVAVQTHAALSGRSLQAVSVHTDDHEDAPPAERAAMRCLAAGMNGDSADAATHFTLAWNAGNDDAGTLVVTLLRLAVDLAKGGGGSLAVEEIDTTTGPPVVVPNDAAEILGGQP